MKKHATLSTLIILLACAIPTAALHAAALSNGLKEWDPRSIQGKIMEVGPDYIVVAEKYIYILDTSYNGKDIKTRIVDNKGEEVGKYDLKKGKYVFVRGGMAYDENRATDVLLAIEVNLINKPLDLKGNTGHRQRFNEHAKPW